MASLLEGEIAKRVYSAFKGKLLSGTLRRESVDESSGLDEFGDPITQDASTWDCQGFVDEYSEFIRAQARIPDTDLKISIFAKSLPSGIRPVQGDQVKFRGTWYQLRNADTDPAEALWVCRGYEIEDPS